MANIGFSQRRTIAYLYGWTAALAALALALRFVPYSDDRGDFDPVWTAVMVAFLLLAVWASIRLLVALEILKLRRFRFRQVDAAMPGEPAQEVVDEGVARELESGEFETVDPATGTVQKVDPETGEFEAIDPPAGR
jgi:UDP-GlcNAc:undecaprenyl-phosphate GlcNAc-1-phosphate transferase